MSTPWNNAANFRQPRQQVVAAASPQRSNVSSVGRPQIRAVQQQLIQRKSASSLTQQEQQAYTTAVTAMINDGSYAALVEIHADMSHNMHYMGTPTSRHRFLPWHRAYLLKMEAELRLKNSAAFIPYLDWTQSVPQWIADFRPDVTMPSGTVIKNQRAHTNPITTAARLGVVTIQGSYELFTTQLENDPHDLGHRLFGYPMRRVAVAPCDPIFWMHHGAVDRLWAQWQASHPGRGPTLTGSDAIMDPWTDTVTSLASISSLGYSYV